MDYYIKRTVERVRQRRRSRADIEEEMSIDESKSARLSVCPPAAGAPERACRVQNDAEASSSVDLHLAARNSIANMDIAHDDSVECKDGSR
ncbi:uncharacterized protein MAM_06411 [Metarhizium album ARSEF 1941]|uniref:Uncharacterized protein n=1 Tax=Metarhizium album (strain ARSEF 1941) TaxID=1081103 RepID=A0A0B2WQA7_METAS|nr:uncharacterized protein MAM_06411 [Metarhizium album ARSEF 1941]KHN95799.1 hypothetical protein MAM_06411 [Metarhizium album ARSEF 1941]